MVPAELDEVYPLSQHETATPLDAETIDHVAKQVANYIAEKKKNYKSVVLVENPEIWQKKITFACKKACRKHNLSLIVVGQK